MNKVTKYYIIITWGYRKCLHLGSNIKAILDVLVFLCSFSSVPVKLFRNSKGPTCLRRREGLASWTVKEQHLKWLCTDIHICIWWYTGDSNSAVNIKYSCTYCVLGTRLVTGYMYALAEFSEFYEVLFFPSKAQDSFSNWLKVTQWMCGRTEIWNMITNLTIIPQE